MTEDRRAYWNSVFANHQAITHEREHWLYCYADVLSPGSRVLDLGCGTGGAAEYLMRAGHTVVAADISTVALRKLSTRLPEVPTRELDMTQGLPWPAARFDAVVADLCLHYFDEATTRYVVDEILRVLRPRGAFLGRVNSTEDTAHGAGAGTPVEPGFYCLDGHYKRFYDRSSVEAFFGGFRDIRVLAGTARTGRGTKRLYEIVGRRP
jgi:SAM-dependent methyltransferase